MKFITVIATAVLMAAPSFVAAKSCNRGGVYCGQSLLNRGDYHDHIVKVLKAAKQPFDDVHIRASIFGCISNGDIVFRGYCSKGCGGVGSEDPDFCL